MDVPFGLELRYVAALRRARKDFFSTLRERAEEYRASAGVRPLSREELKLLRSEGITQIAEFFFVLQEGDLSAPDRLRSFLERHNEDMKAMLATCVNGYSASGLSKPRLERAIFTDKQIAYVMHESAHGEVRFDQQSLQRIFTQIMSFESCRTLLELLADSGFLNRYEFGHVLISSKGSLEDLYRKHIQAVVAAIVPPAEKAVA